MGSAADCCENGVGGVAAATVERARIAIAFGLHVKNHGSDGGRAIDLISSSCALNVFGSDVISAGAGLPSPASVA